MRTILLSLACLVLACEPAPHNSLLVKVVGDCDGEAPGADGVAPGEECDAENPCAPICCDCREGIEQVNSVLVYSCVEGVCISESDACGPDTGMANSQYCE